MVLTTFISFGAGLFSGIYLSQNYELPNKDERQEIYKDLKAIWKEKMEARCNARKTLEHDNNISIAKRVESASSVKNQPVSNLNSSNNKLDSFPPRTEKSTSTLTCRQVFEKYKKRKNNHS